MILDFVLKALIALLPSLVLLSVLLHMDTHRLLGSHLLGRTFVVGALLAVISYFCNGFAIDILALDFNHYTRYGAPVLEEALKAGALVFLFRRNRVGFLVDAALLGFTVGTGFSLVENLYYLYQASEAHYLTWAVRGFGTAIMHGGATAIFAVITQILTERHLRLNPFYYLPGLLAAVLLHSIFNHFPVSPILSTAVTALILPTLFFLLFERNAVTIHNFLEMDFEAHRKLLRQIEGGAFTECEAGRFLQDLEKIFSTPVVHDMIYYIRLHTELILSAEGILLAREQGIDIEIESETHEKLGELHLLERRIGKTGLHAMRPHLHLSRQELWEIHMLEERLATAG